MAIKLVILHGPRRGEEFIVRDDIIIGRSRGDLMLRDTKVSNPHAHIRLLPNNMYEIEDLESSNGVYVNDICISRGPIFVNDRIKLGETVLGIEDLLPQKKGADFDPDSWQQRVMEALAEAKVQTPASTLEAFSMPLALEIIQGPQVGERFSFGFGPRKVGSAAAEGLLLDGRAPRLAFEVHAGDSEEAFWTLKKVDSSVRLNEQPIRGSSVGLRVGDRISIGSTILEVKIQT